MVVVYLNDINKFCNLYFNTGNPTLFFKVLSGSFVVK